MLYPLYLVVFYREKTEKKTDIYTDIYTDIIRHFLLLTNWCVLFPAVFRRANKVCAVPCGIPQG